MSQFPYQLDSDADLPRVDNNITEIGGDAINALRAAMFNVEADIGIGAAGTAGSIAQRLNVSLMSDGTINPSALVNLLSIVMITDAQVSPTAGIHESKLNLSYSTASLYNLYATLKTSVDILNGWLAITGVKLEPHIDGTNYNHLLSAIHVDPSTIFVKTSPAVLPSAGTNVVNRDTTNSDTLVQDISNDLVIHEKSDGSAGVTPTAGGTVPPENFAHMASGVYVDTASFTTIPQSDTNVQSIIDFIDSSSLLLLGSRIQNFYENGVSRTSRSTSFFADGYGSPIVPPTPAIAYFLGVPPGPPSSSPHDDINNGDDVILFNPTSSQLTTFNFDAQFAQVAPGDLLTINYGTGISYQFYVDSVKSIVNSVVTPPVRQYAVRINGKNPVSDGYAVARIDKPTFNRNKYAVIASARAPNSMNGIYESLIVIHPRSALALGNGFNPSQLDANHYNLYLTLLPNGDLTNIFQLPAIDVTGNQGAQPGSYTLDSVVDTINAAFRQPGFNYRFNAFQYNGQIGIALDPYNNASFSVVAGVPDGYGNYTSTSNFLYPKNVVDNFNLIDPLGFGVSAANIASPPAATSYSTVITAEFAPTLFFYPLKRNFFYTNGSELEQLKSDPLVLNNIEDANGDGYWPATVTNIVIGASTVSLTYTVNLDLADSGLAVGKTIVVQPLTPIVGTSGDTNYGRFLISSVVFDICANPSTTITVYDAIHGTGVSPFATLSLGAAVNVYFSDDSVTFDAENVFDGAALPPGDASGPFKRFFEVYVDNAGHTFTHERGRFLSSGNDVRLNGAPVPSDLAQINLYGISPKLKGYPSPYLPVGTRGSVIYLTITAFDSGTFTGQLCSSTFTQLGPLTTGRYGEVVRFYDATNIDYIDFIFNVNASNLAGSFPETIAIQLFDSLELNQTFMLLSTCQVNDSSKAVSYLTDQRQFGNVSEEQLTTSALDFITSNPRHTMQNGIVRGFDLLSSSTVSNPVNVIDFDGGLALVNGNLEAFNPFTITMPLVQDNNGGSPVPGILWAICANKNNEIQLIPLTDFDPSVNSIDNPGRLLQLSNTITVGPAYYVDSTTFSILINSRKDLTVLWLVNAQVNTSTSYSFTLMDARKYVTDINSVIRPTLTDETTQGNFQDIQSALIWFRYNSVYQNTLNIKSSYAFSSDPGFSALSSLNVVGDGVGAQLAFGLHHSGVYNFSGINFTNITLIFSATNTVSNSIITNCTVGLNGLGTYTGVTFNNCVINIGLANSFTGCIFNNCTITVTSAVIVTVGSGCAFNGCTISNTIATGTVFSIPGASSNISFIGCNMTYRPSTPGGYPSNLVNSGTAWIYSSVSLLENIKIDSCEFVTSNSARASFINLEYNSPTAIAQGVYITNNKFYNTSNADDIQAVISIVSTLTTASSLEGMKLIDCLIANNFCDKEQMIIITGTPDGSFNINTTVVPVGTRISGNSCGAIGLVGMTDYDRVSSFDTATNNIGYDKNYNCVIEKNTCRFIGSLQYNGQFPNGFQDTPSSSTPYVNVNTCPVAINDNTCHWIMMVSSGLTDDSFNKSGVLKITNNTLRAYNSAYLTNFSSSLTNAAIFVQFSDEINATLYAPTIIQGNSTNTGKYLTSSSTQVYDYENCVLVENANATITGNVFNNILSGGTMVSVGPTTTNGISNYTITNNQFYRNTTNISSYISTAFCYATITHNFFDSTTVNGTSDVLTALGFGTTFIYRENKNQTGYAQVDPNSLNWLTSSIPTGREFFNNTHNGGLATTGWSMILTGPVNDGVGGPLAVNVSLDDIVPQGARLTYAVIGANVFSGSGTKNMAFSVIKGVSNVFTAGTFTGSIADLGANGGDFGASVHNSATSGFPTPISITAGSGSTNYVYLDLNSVNLGGDGSLQIFLLINISDGSQILLSPFLVKYIW